MAKLSTLLVLSGLSWVDALVLPSHASPVPARAVTAKEYDFVIVGGGPAGLTLADRITEDPKGSSKKLIRLCRLSSSANGKQSPFWSLKQAPSTKGKMVLTFQVPGTLSNISGRI